MKTRLISINELTTTDEAAWSALAERALEPNPFFEPSFLIPAKRHFEGFSRTRLLIAQDGADFFGVLPIIDVERTKIPPRTTMTTRGDPTALSGSCVPLVDRSSPDAVVRALLEGLQAGARRRELPGILSFKRLVEGGPVLASIRREAAALGMPTYTKESWERGVVTRDGKWEQPLSGKHRRENARRRRALAAECGGEVRTVDRSRDPSARDDFIKLEASGWKGLGQGTAFARDPRKVAWFEEWSDRWVASGRAIVMALEAGNSTVAMWYCLSAGEGIFLFRTAYDENYARYSPGALLLETVLMELFDRTHASWVDSSTDPGNNYLLQMLPERRMISMVLVGTGGRVDRTLVSTMPTLTRAVRELRRIREHVKRKAPEVQANQTPDDQTKVS